MAKGMVQEVGRWMKKNLQSFTLNSSGAENARLPTPSKTSRDDGMVVDLYKQFMPTIT